MRAKATYAVSKWDESTLDQISATTKMTKASVEYSFSGELQGKAKVEYLMFYRHFDLNDQHRARASYTGLVRFEGTLAGKAGSFVMQDSGTFEGGAAVSALQIHDGSGTGSLAGISGTATYRADREGCHFEIDYNLP
jgi:hypothetical protein